MSTSRIRTGSIVTLRRFSPGPSSARRSRPGYLAARAVLSSGALDSVSHNAGSETPTRAQNARVLTLRTSPAETE